MTLQKKHILTVVVILCAMVLPAAMASAADADTESFGFGGFSIGSQWLDISELNSVLSSNGFASFNNPTLSLGFESYFAFQGKFLFGLEFQLFWQEATNATYVQKLNGYWGFLNFGYSVLPKSVERFHLYPLFGLGVSRNRLRLTEREVLDFSDIITDPQRESFLTKWDFLLQAALGADFSIGGFNMSENGGDGRFMLGIRAGYQYSVTDSTWNMSTLDISGSPGLSMSGFYLRFIIGGLGYRDSFDKHDREM